MKLLKGFFITFSMYSKIPMPEIAWKEEDMKYSLCFFPLVGVLIGLLLLLWVKIGAMLSLGMLSFTLVGVVIPLLVSGGIHLDGFMDSMDALHSYQEREEKLRILKDVHVGAFSVICLLWYYLLYIAAFSEIRTLPLLFILALGFPVSRCLSGLSLLFFPKAKKEGSLNSFSDTAERAVVLPVLAVQCLFYMGMMLYSSFTAGIFVILGNLVFFFYYRWKAVKEFGGISGDTAGWYLVLSEGITAGILMLYSILERGIR